MAINKYTNPVTMHVERSPIDSSLLKYCTVNEINNLLKQNMCSYYFDRNCIILKITYNAKNITNKHHIILRFTSSFKGI